MDKGSAGMLSRGWRRKIAYKVLPIFPPFVMGVVRGVCGTLRVSVEGSGFAEEMIRERRPFIFAFFHGRQFLLLNHHRDGNIIVMTSISYLGEIQARILKGFGYTAVRGSSTKQGSRVLIKIIREIGEGTGAAFAVDGPKGPLHKVKPGIIFLAKKMALPIIPVAFSALPSILFRSQWDHYLLPLPFARARILYSEPFCPDGDLSREAVERDAARLEEILSNLEKEADIAVGRIRK